MAEDFGDEYMLMRADQWPDHVRDLFYGKVDAEAKNALMGRITAAVAEGRVTTILVKRLDTPDELTEITIRIKGEK